MVGSSKVSLGGESFVPAFIQLAQKSQVMGEEMPITKEASSGGKVSTFTTATGLVTSIVGASIMGFPSVFGRGGWYVSPVCLLVACLISVETAYAMEESIRMIWARLEKGEAFTFTKPEKYEDLCEAAWGKKGRALGSFCVNAFMLALSSAYMILMGQCFEYLIDKAFWSPYRACVLATSIFFVPLSLADDMSFLAKLTIIGTIASVAYAVSIGWGGLQAGSLNPNVTYNYYPERPTELGNVVAVFFLAFTFQMVAPTLRSEMQEPRELPKAVNWALSLVSVVYVAAGSLGYYGWGNKVEGNVLRNMRTEDGRMWAGIMLGTAVICNLLVTFPIFMSIVGRALESSTVGHYSPTLRLLLLAFAFSVGMFLPYFMEFLGLLGSVLGVMVGAFLPLGSYWALVSQEEDDPAKQENRKGLAVRHGICILFAVVTLIFGTWTAVNDLASAMASAPPGFWDYSY